MPGKYSLSQIEQPKGQYSLAEAKPAEKESGGFGTFVSTALSRLNPMEIAKGMGESIMALVEHPSDTALEGMPFIGPLKRAKAAYDAGDHRAAAVHVLAAVAPVGASLEQSGVDIAHGEVAKGLGTVAGDALAAAVPMKGPQLVGRTISKAGQLATPVGRAIMGAVPEIPVFPRNIGDYAAPFRGAKEGFIAGRDAVAARELAALPEYQPPAPDQVYRPSGAPMPMEPPAAPLQGPLREGHPAASTRYPAGTPLRPPLAPSVPVAATGAYSDAVDVLKSVGKVSTSILQRHLRVGYGEALKMINRMEQDGLIGPAEGNAPRTPLPRSGNPPPAENVSPTAPETVTLTEPRWDASKLPPDPVKQTEWYQKALRELRERRAGKPAEAKPAEAAPSKPEAPAAYLDQETTGLQGPEQANRARVVAKIGDKLAGGGLTSEQLPSLTEAPKFWELAGKLHGEKYMPSEATVDAIRDYVKAKQGAKTPSMKLRPDVVVRPPSALANNPKALKIATKLADLMNEAKGVE